MLKKLLTFIFLPLILLGCSKDEPSNGLFTFAVSSMPVGAEYSVLNENDFSVSTNGLAQSFVVDLMGDFDAIHLSDDIPEWISGSVANHCLYVSISDFSSGEDNDSRHGVIGFTVSKGSQSVSGRIIIHQYPLTYEDLLLQEQTAIDEYLHSISATLAPLPTDGKYQVGENAAFYTFVGAQGKGTVYMRILELGNQGVAKTGDKVYFRFLRWNILNWYLTGNIGEGQGNGATIYPEPLWFDLGIDNEASNQWGKGIQLPMAIGLPYGSKVELIVPSQLGLSDEVNYVIPYLYEIQYFKASF